MNYNLLDEKWIPVLFKNGAFDRLGISQTLAEAHAIRQIASSNPMDRAAILRFLLALLYWCHGNPPDRHSSPNSFPTDWSKLKENKDCFNLLGDSKRFYQHREISYKKKKSNEKKSANYLIHEVPTGSNWWHFRHSIDGQNGLCLPCCAIGLLRLPPFSTVRGPGNIRGINGAPPIYIFPTGSSLADTLLLLWQRAANIGYPQWEKELPSPDSSKDPLPLLFGLTWLPRLVWLDDPDDHPANCISCGQKAPLIRYCIFEPAPKIQKPNWTDPHISPMPQANSSTWWLVNFSTNQAKYFEASEYKYRIPPSIPSDHHQNCIDQQKRLIENFSNVDSLYQNKNKSKEEKLINRSLKYIHHPVHSLIEEGAMIRDVAADATAAADKLTAEGSAADKFTPKDDKGRKGGGKKVDLPPQVMEAVAPVVKAIVKSFLAPNLAPKLAPKPSYLSYLEEQDSLFQKTQHKLSLNLSKSKSSKRKSQARRGKEAITQ
ncbi:MAG: type I-E CRISPR-associated protein Cse1/CasA [bacterium]|nr:type I-E CRISPR-associated protein Cse1/CasA [bacterium]